MKTRADDRVYTAEVNVTNHRLGIPVSYSNKQEGLLHLQLNLETHVVYTAIQGLQPSRLLPPPESRF